jgi:hypothetical protein
MPRLKRQISFSELPDGAAGMAAALSKLLACSPNQHESPVAHGESCPQYDCYRAAGLAWQDHGAASIGIVFVAKLRHTTHVVRNQPILLGTGHP